MTMLLPRSRPRLSRLPPRRRFRLFLRLPSLRLLSLRLARQPSSLYSRSSPPSLVFSPLRLRPLTSSLSHPRLKAWDSRPMMELSRLLRRVSPRPTRGFLRHRSRPLLLVHSFPRSRSYTRWSPGGSLISRSFVSRRGLSLPRSLPGWMSTLGFSLMPVSTGLIALTSRSLLSWLWMAPSSVSSILISRTPRSFLYWKLIVNPLSPAHVHRLSNLCGRTSIRGCLATAVSTILTALTPRSPLCWPRLTPKSTSNIPLSRSMRSLIYWNLVPVSTTPGYVRPLSSLLPSMPVLGLTTLTHHPNLSFSALVYIPMRSSLWRRTTSCTDIRALSLVLDLMYVLRWRPRVP